jgi:hypothetical protein
MERNTVCDSVRQVGVVIDNRQRQTYRIVMSIFGDVACTYESKWLPRSKHWQNDKHRQADNTRSTTTNNFRYCINTCDFFFFFSLGCVTSAFRMGVKSIFALLVFYPEGISIISPTFRDKLTA